jgi:hypothetical protein
MECSWFLFYGKRNHSRFFLIFKNFVIFLFILFKFKNIFLIIEKTSDSFVKLLANFRLIETLQVKYNLYKLK